MSIANSGKKGEDYDFDIDILKNCPDVVQYFSLSNDDNPEINLDFLNLVFVRLPKFVKPLEQASGKLLTCFQICQASSMSRVFARMWLDF